MNKTIITITKKKSDCWNKTNQVIVKVAIRLFVAPFGRLAAHFEEDVAAILRLVLFVVVFFSVNQTKTECNVIKIIKKC